jgi:hypothetical protein
MKTHGLFLSTLEAHMENKNIGAMILIGIWAVSAGGAILTSLPDVAGPSAVQSAALSDGHVTAMPGIEPIDATSDKGRFQTGEQVVLLDNDPPAGIGLKAGRLGTVLRCAGDSGNVLVSWDLWTDEKANSSPNFDGLNALYPAFSAMWVNPDQVRIGHHFKQCGTIRQGLEGRLNFEADDGKTYNVVSPDTLYTSLIAGAGGFRFGDRVQVQGLLNTAPEVPGVTRTYPQSAGDLFHPVLLPCPSRRSLPDPLTIDLVGNPLQLVPEPNSPGPDYTYDGHTSVTFELNFRAKLSLLATPISGVGGTWTGTITPDVVGPGTVTIQISVHVEHLDISTLPQGNLKTANVTLTAIPKI